MKKTEKSSVLSGNRRQLMMILSAVCLLLLGMIALGGWLWQDKALEVDFPEKIWPPVFSILSGQTGWGAICL